MNLFERLQESFLQIFNFEISIFIGWTKVLFGLPYILHIFNFENSVWRGGWNIHLELFQWLVWKGYLESVGYEVYTSLYFGNFELWNGYLEKGRGKVSLGLLSVYWHSLEVNLDFYKHWPIFLQTQLLFINYKFVYRFKIKNVNFRYSQWFCKLCKNLTAVTWLVSYWCQWCEYLILLKLCQIYKIDPAAMQRLELVNWAVNMCQRVQVPEKGWIFTLQQKDRKFKRKF